MGKKNKMENRTQEEIVAQIRAVSGKMLCFEPEVLLPFLDFAHAKEFLKPEAKEADWKQSPLESALGELREYMTFAWGEDHRGISASRSVDKCAAWAWILGRGDIYKKAHDDENYAQYGAPALKLICEAFDLPIPQGKGLQRMMAGEPCHDHCDQGCGK